MGAKMLPSFLGLTDNDNVPLPYTVSPLQLLGSDIRLFFRNLRFLPGILLPLEQSNSGKMGELHPSWENMFDFAVHGFLCVAQALFLLSLPMCVIFMLPVAWIIVYIALFLGINRVICDVALNGKERFLVSKVPVMALPEHEREHWIFVNGVAVGHHWLQSNIDRLACTFGRKVTGVLNPTCGVLFDVVECLIQRNFRYATQDVRDAYPYVKKALLNPQFKKVVLILHSQGGIEGGLIIDWLLDEMPQDLLQKLEVYTFGNAANHFNNPYRTVSKLQDNIDITLREKPCRPQTKERWPKSIRYIEHYANAGDFVSVWGVLNFIRIPNRYMGRLLVQSDSGHLMNQHYLDRMFSLGPDGRVLDANNFMDMPIDVEEHGAAQSEEREEIDEYVISSSGDAKRRSGRGRALKVKDFSRLWLYRNGRSPPDAQG